ncbi:MAG: hypothetical protein WDM85_07155 [Caulobacteraceae bacterium]
MTLDRRQWLMGAGAAAGLAASPRIAFAAAETDRRLVVIMLRGAMDGLSAAPPVGDPDYETARTGLAIGRPGTASGALALDGTFGLHPALAKLNARYAAKELIVFHAIASPYRDPLAFRWPELARERGRRRRMGWRTVGSTARWWVCQVRRAAGRAELGIALAPAMPLMLRGAVAGHFLVAVGAPWPKRRPRRPRGQGSTRRRSQAVDRADGGGAGQCRRRRQWAARAPAARPLSP